MSNTVRKTGSSYIHYIITLGIMFIISSIPPSEPLTAFGMRVLGVFAGVIYAFSAINIIWASIAAIVGLGIATGNMSTLLAQSLGSQLVWGLIFIQVVLYAITEAGIVKYFANLIISRKILKGRPWLFSLFLQLGVFVVAWISPFAAMFLFWNIINMVCDTFGMERNCKWAQLMIFGTCFSAGFSVASIPVLSNGLVISNLYFNSTGMILNGTKFLVTMLPLCIISLVLFIVLCKYVFKCDVGELKNINDSIVDKESLHLDKRQFVVLIIFFCMMMLLLVPAVCPDKWSFTIFFRKLGLFGTTAVIVLLLAAIRIDKKPLLDIQAGVCSIPWAPIFMVGIIMPLTGLLTSPDTGVMMLLNNILTPILAGKSSWIFMWIIVLVSIILTNLAQNLVIIGIMLPVMFVTSQTTGMNMAAMTIILGLATHYACILPSASPAAGIMFANENIEKSTIYKYGTITLIVCTIFLLTLGYLWVNIIF